MLPCEEVRELVEEYVDDTLEVTRRREVVRHLRVCEPCHHMTDEARLAKLVLDETGPPPPPPSLAERIKHAALMRQRHRPRPLHQRALGSPAFLATCASLLCGAVICLLAIMKVASVQPWPEAPVPQVSIVERLKLPARNLARPTRPVAAAFVARADAPRARRDRLPALMTVPVKHRNAPPAPRSRASQASRPQRALMAFTPPSPSLSLTPTLPESILVPARERISQPEIVRPISYSEPLGAHAPAALPDDAAGRLDLSDLAGPQPSRADFTSTR